MHRTAVVLPVALLGAIALVPPAATRGGEASAGEVFQARCASCHTVPDPALRTDRAWLDQIQRTAWTSTPPGVRETLIRWLERQAPPKRVDKATDAAAGLGRVTANFAAGSVVLAGPSGDVTLVWQKGGVRALPAGTYRVRTTRVEKEEGGTHWFISATSPPREQYTVKAGRAVRIAFDETVHFEPRIRRKGDEMQLGFTIKAADGRGLSVYKNDRRVPVTYKVLAKDGKVLASGAMNYGWGGGGWASVKPKGRPARVVFAVETGPFPLQGSLEATLD